MNLLSYLDIGLALLVVGVAIWTIAARELFAAVVGYVAYGLLLAFVWIRLYAPDVALTEAAVGGGVTGVLLITAGKRLGALKNAAPDVQPGLTFKLLTGALAALVASAVGAAILMLPDPPPSLAPEAAAAADSAGAGLGNPITAVLMSYRSFDTMLEKIVLILAVIGVWSVGTDKGMGRHTGAVPPTQALCSDGLSRSVASTHRRCHRNSYVLDRCQRARRRVSGRRLACGDVDGHHDGAAGGAAPHRRAVASPGFGRRTSSIPRRRPRGGGCSGRLLCLSAEPRQANHSVHRSVHAVVHHGGVADARRRSAERETGSMTPSVLAGLVGAALVGLGVYGLILHPHPLRKLLAFNLIGSGVFLVFGIVARRGAAAGFRFDPVPQAMVITGIVVAFAASALAVALILRLATETGRVTLDPEAWTLPKGEDAK